MKNPRISLLFLVSAFLFGNINSGATALTEEDIKKVQQETWTVTFITNVNDIYPSAIQYAIINEDLLPVFKANLAILRNNPKLNDDTSTNLQVAWDAIFKKITGEKVGLLPPKSDREFAMCSNETEGQKWVITKTAMKSNGAVLCWYVPIEVKIGENYQIELDERNAFDFQKFI